MASAGQGQMDGIHYCLDAVHRPVQPSDRTNDPEPLRPEKRPELFQLKPETDPPDVVEPFGLTLPELSSPTILPPLMTNLSVLAPQGVPMALETHDPSKFPPPPAPPPSPLPLFREARRGSSAWGLLRRAGFSVSTDRGACREPDMDFSSLPMLPPALPDCASAGAGPIAIASTAPRTAIPIRRRMAFGMSLSNHQHSAAGAVGTRRPDNPARFASLAALVKRRILGPLDGVPRHQRP